MTSDSAERGPAAPDIGFRPTIAAMVRRIAATYGDDDAIVTAEARLSYAGLEVASRNLAKLLVSSGIGKGCRVGLLFPNSPEWVTSFLAVGRIGAIAVPLSTFYPPPELRKVLRLADVHTLLTAATLFGDDSPARLEEALPGLADTTVQPLLLPEVPALRAIFLSGSRPEVAAPPWARRWTAAEAPDDGRVTDEVVANLEAEVSAADLLVLLHTSGSTADPKGVFHTHGAVVRHSYLLSQWAGVGPPYRNVGRGERLFASQVFFWVAGLQQDLLAQLHSGGALLLQDRPDVDPEAALALMERERATQVTGHGGLKALAHPSARRRDLTSVVPLHAGVTAEDRRRRHAGCGMTETLSNHTHAQHEFDRVLPERLWGATGIPLPFMEHRIVDPTTRQPVAEGTAGVLLLRGFALMAGMNKREREEVFDADGWYDTGDRCALREGYLFYLGRFGEMIKTSGANVAPLEVEAALLELPEVAQAAVVGVPDPERGQRVAAALVLADPAADPAELLSRLRADISSYKVPRQYTVLAEDLPRLHNGKVDKRTIVELLSATDEATSSSPRPTQTATPPSPLGPSTRASSAAS